MTDRELLELAAKAAGLTCVWSPDRPDYESNQEQQPIYWNPLEDDGDALRLAVKLEIDFRISIGATWWDRQVSEGVVYWCHEPHNNDPLAATRRAIVRAAAEIGMGMA